MKTYSLSPSDPILATKGFWLWVLTLQLAADLLLKEVDGQTGQSSVRLSIPWMGFDSLTVNKK
eukprot:scaffold8013_cov139-Amphora_coffeaeformis.AAC.9